MTSKQFSAIAILKLSKRPIALGDNTSPLLDSAWLRLESCNKSQHSKEERLMINSFLMLTVIATSVVAVRAADQNTRVVIYDGVATEVSAEPASSSDLWITTGDLTRATRFVIKPQGVCRDELCFPLPKNRKAEFVSKKGTTTWFNLSAFAKLIRQPVVVDQKNGVWYFGARDAEQNGYLTSLEAPNFTLPDLNGKLHSLADFRGQKVLLVTWASW